MRKAIRLFGMLAVLLLLGACEEGGYPVYPTQPVPTIYPPIGPNGTNATRAEFDGYRNEWRSQSVREYRIEVEYDAYSELMGTWTLDVETDGKSSKVIKYARDPNGAPGAQGYIGSANAMPTDTAGIEYVSEKLGILTIESMFENASASVDGKYRDMVETYLQFDSALGYLSSIDDREKPGVADAGFNWKVTKLEILSRATPTP